MARRRRHTGGVKELAERRRARLQAWIDKHYEDSNASEFARVVRRRQSYIADLLRGAKSFGEKVARDLEILGQMPPGYLDDDTDDRMAYHGILLTRAGAQLGAEWEKLDLVDRIELEEEIRRRVQKKVLSDRDKGIKPPPPETPN